MRLVAVAIFLGAKHFCECNGKPAKSAIGATKKEIQALFEDVGTPNAGKLKSFEGASFLEQSALAASCNFCHLGRFLIESDWDTKGSPEMVNKQNMACASKADELAAPFTANGNNKISAMKMGLRCKRIMEAMVPELTEMRAKKKKFNKFCLGDTGACIPEIDGPLRASAMEEKKKTIAKHLEAFEYFEDALKKQAKKEGANMKQFMKFVKGSKSWKQLDKARKTLESNDEDTENVASDVTKSSMRSIIRGVQDAVVEMFQDKYKVSLKQIFDKFGLNEDAPQQKDAAAEEEGKQEAASENDKDGTSWESTANAFRKAAAEISVEQPQKEAAKPEL